MNLFIYAIVSILLFLVALAIIGGALFGVIAMIYGSITWVVNQFKQQKMGFIFRLQSFWFGIHHSKYTKRTCINILPCITLWIGNKPSKI